MMVLWTVALWFGVVLCGHPIDTVVLLMEENRSFDHYLGWMKKDRPDVNGLTGKEYNQETVGDPKSKKVYVEDTAKWVDAYDPDHGFSGVTHQVFGGGKETSPAPMNGFVDDNKHRGDGSMVMKGFTKESVPILTTLANEFALFDEWFCSVPGPTNPNRRFLHAGTAGGSMDDADYDPVGFPQSTIFDELDAVNKSWAIYFFDWSPSCMFSRLRTPSAKARFFPMSQFYVDAKAGKLPYYSFIEPRMFPSLSKDPANDQHPDHDVREGERLMKDVYEAVRAGPQWEHLLYIITYDEHGGYYDHVPTPLGCPNPDGLNTSSFHFNREGIRVPTVMISPWIDKGVLLHGPPDSAKPTATSVYEHSSVLATFRKLFGIKSLTHRDAWAAPFDSVWSTRTTPRTDCPMTLPAVPSTEAERLAAHQREANRPLNGLQRDMVWRLSTCNYPTLAHRSPGSVREEINRLLSMTQLEAGAALSDHFKEFLRST